MLYDSDDRMARPTFLTMYGIEPSTEKRARAEGLPWPPYKVLGGRVYYSQTLVAAWFAQHDSAKHHDLQAPGDSASVVSSEAVTEVEAP